MAPQPCYETEIVRYYIDTRPLVPSQPKQPYKLPLISSLQSSDQEAITRFIRPADKFMSLASALLKYTFVHRYAKIPWNEVLISRTPHPHRRPYWHPPAHWVADGGLEFNVSHQAGLVAIVGCQTPNVQASTGCIVEHVQDISLAKSAASGPDDGHQHIRLGVDVACTNEDHRTPTDLVNQAKFDEWVEVFAEMFSERERTDMKRLPVRMPVGEMTEFDDMNDTLFQDQDTSQEEAEMIHFKLRRFYTYWALKEAYIKMVGEGLLASWLRDLEFVDVVAPLPPDARRTGRIRGVDSASEGDKIEEAKWTAPAEAERGMSTLFKGKKVENVRVEVVAYDEDFLVATAARGVVEPPGDEDRSSNRARRWIKLDIVKDIQPCAEGTCRCIDR